ncbi:MAG: hypothetical protein Cons2KO_19230 [Congregibacter sp.]
MQYAAQRWGLARWLYGQEGKALLAYEQTVSRHVDKSFFVSAPEAALFKCRANEEIGDVSYFCNGVDAQYFKSDPDRWCPYSKNARVLVFTGAMDYAPNVEAVSFFAKQVFPQLRAHHSLLQFWIVGSNPTPEVRSLSSIDGICVSGRVPDVRPYLQHALAAVAPMKIARGIQNKVLEALAMGIPVLASEEALTGIEVPGSVDCPPHGSVSEYAESVDALIAHGDHGAMNRRREWIESEFSWAARLSPVLEALR